MRWMKWLNPRLKATLIIGVLGVVAIAHPTFGASITIPGGTASPPSLLVEDVSVTITDNLTTTTPGSLVTTVITLKNHWDQPRKLDLRYLRPKGLTAFTVTFVSSDGYSVISPLGYDKLELHFADFFDFSDGGKVLAMPGGSSVVITLISTVTAPETGTGTITSRVVISSPQFDERPSNNEATDITFVGPPATAKGPTSVATSTPTAKPILTTGPTTIGATPPSSTSVAVVVPATTLLASTLAPTTIPAAAPVDGFQSPIGTTKCLLVANPVTGQAMRCTAIGSTAKLPRRPATCDFDWEDIAINATGRAYTVCAGDSIDANYPVLAYGQTWKRSVFTCTSAKSGITCRNPSKRGFRISKTKRTYL